MRDQKIIETEVLNILASATHEEMLSRMRTYMEALPEDELEYAQGFTAKRRKALEDALGGIS